MKLIEIEGPEGSKAKIAFMATYNIDRLRDFVFQSSYVDYIARSHLAIRAATILLRTCLACFGLILIPRSTCCFCSARNWPRILRCTS